ncbi:P22 phage major capsid protein family protein [Mycobacterium sp. CSUR Q5927]|nr:P22 phage major capsid protein family protein [Mycobacterium sp. CSUR Q5927]
MAFTHFIPTLWSTALLESWQATAVFGNLVNRTYEGLASRGNKVTISGVVVPTVKDYKTGVGGQARTTAADAISDTGIDLLIDQEKIVDFYVQDIDRIQAAGSLDEFTTASGQALAVDSDKFIAQAAVDDAGVSVPGTAPTTGDQAFNLLNTAQKLLTKKNVPFVGRVAVVNAEFAALLKGADSKLTNFNTSGDTAGLRDGTIGSLGGARVVETNTLPEMDEPQFVLFHQRAIGYVSQIEEVEALRAHDRVADRIRMLHVYGAKVLRSDGVAVFNAGTGS